MSTEAIHKVVLLEARPDLGLSAGEVCGLRASQVTALQSGTTPKVRILQRDIAETAGH